MRVLVARPEPAAGATAARLAALGHRPLVAPVTTIRRTNAPPPEDAFDGLIVTSANAAPALARWPGSRTLPLFAVGRRTAERLAADGLGPATWAEDAPGLAREIARRLRPGAALLHVAGRDRKPEPAASLTGSGFHVVAWETYAAEPVAGLPSQIAAALDEGRLDAALHFSRRSAAILTGLVREAGRGEAFGRLAHLCLSADVAAALDGETRVAERPDEAALLALLDGA